MSVPKTRCRILTHIFLIILIVIVSACSSEEGDWKQASAEDSIEAYRDFIHEHPNSQFVDEARNRIIGILYQPYSDRNSVYAYQTFIREYPDSSFAAEAKSRIQALYEKRRLGLREVRKARIELATEFPQGTELGFLKGKRWKTRILLQIAGIEPLSAKDEEDCLSDDCMTFKIYVKGSPRGRRYYMGIVPTVGQSGRYLFTGARITGYIAFMVNNKTVVKKSFQKQKNPPEKTVVMNNDYPNKRSEAPFLSVWKGINYRQILFDLFEQEFGRDTLIDAMPEIVKVISNVELQSGGDKELVKLLTEVRPQHRIIGLLSDNYSYAAHEVAVLALGKILEPWTIDPLLRTMKKDYSYTAAPSAAARALGELEDVPPRVVEALIEELDKRGRRRRYVRRAALEALKKISNKNFGEDYWTWKGWWKSTRPNH